MNTQSYLRTTEKDSHKQEVLMREAQLATWPPLNEVVNIIRGTIGILTNRRANTAEKTV